MWALLNNKIKYKNKKPLLQNVTWNKWTIDATINNSPILLHQVIYQNFIQVSIMKCNIGITTKVEF